MIDIVHGEEVSMPGPIAGSQKIEIAKSRTVFVFSDGPEGFRTSLHALPDSRNGPPSSLRPVSTVPSQSKPVQASPNLESQTVGQKNNAPKLRENNRMHVKGNRSEPITTN